MTGLLDCIYELEGLVHLALSRDDSPEALPELIARKGEELSQRACGIARDTTTVVEVAAPAVVKEKVEIPAPVEAQEIVEIAAPAVVEEKVETPAPVEAQEIVETPAPVEAQEIVETPAPVEAQEIVEIPAPVEIEENIAVSAPVVAEKVVVPKPVSVSPEPRGKLVFSINDRYRFKRELFNNSDADFNNTLAFVASMENYDEAEDYFLGELQWDPSSREVIDFLEILKKYFKE